MNYKQITSFILVSALVAAGMIVLINFTAPNVKAQITHLTDTAAEDWTGGPPNPFDINPAPNIVEWDPAEDHIINDPLGTYFILPGYTLIINGGLNISFQGTGTAIDVFGTLETLNDGNPFTRTSFTTTGFGWQGIYVHPGAHAVINDCYFEQSINGVVFEPGSIMDSPGIFQSRFEQFALYGAQLDGATGHTYIEETFFDASAINSGTGLKVQDMQLNFSGFNTFTSHGPGLPGLQIINSTVSVVQGIFEGQGISGNIVSVEDGSNGTFFKDCQFNAGSVGDHYIRVEGSSPLIENTSFITTGGSAGALTVIAEDSSAGVPAHVTIRNPSGDGSSGFDDDSFDNSTLNATGNSTITLQWYLHVYVIDPDLNFISNAPVWVRDVNGDPAIPLSKVTEGDGYARWFTVTERIVYEGSIDHLNPHNITAENQSVFGYAQPKPMLYKSTIVTVIVPFSLVPNTEPVVAWMTTLTGVYSGMVTIEFILEDPDPGDDGNLSIIVLFSLDGVGFVPCRAGPGSETSDLSNNTLHIYYWDSKQDIPNRYEPTVYIKIIPIDKAGPGTESQTGDFILDNEGPSFLTGPFVTPSNTTVTIEWTVSENADAAVYWGVYDSNSTSDLTTETTGSTGSTTQTVTLTGLTPGRRYIFMLNSTDSIGNKNTSFPASPLYLVETKVYISLFKGWNMISLTPVPLSADIDFQLSSIAGQYSAVRIYDPILDPSDPWKHWVEGKPGELNDLENLFPANGIWIKMKNNAVLTVNHKVILPEDPFQEEIIPLVYGWNFVGYPSVTTTDIGTALQGLLYDKVQTYDAGSGTWYQYDGPAGNPDTLHVMEQGRGYWIHCTSVVGDDWTVPYI